MTERSDIGLSPGPGTAPNLVVIGDANLDIVARGGDIVPRFGQIEQLIDGVDLVLGGSGGITAAAAGRLSVPTRLVAALGDDTFGQQILGALDSKGVDVNQVLVEGDLVTGCTVILATPEDRAILTHLGSIGALRPEHVDLALLEAADHVHVSGYFLLTGMQMGLKGLLVTARRHGATISLDPNWDPTGCFESGLPRLLQVLDILFVNEQEAIALARTLGVGTKTVMDTAMRLNAFVPTVVVKRGPDGALVAQSGNVTHARARQVETVDTIGAGDNFDAGYLAARLRGLPVEECLRLGCACGAESTTRVGGVGMQLTWAQAQEAAGSAP